MSVIADFSLVAKEFVLSHAVATVQEIDLEVERMVAHSDDGLTPYFRVLGSEATLDAFERALSPRQPVRVVDLVGAIGRST